MTPTTPSVSSCDETPVVVRHRATELDRLRGLAVLLMVLDHATGVFEGPGLGRIIGRGALPLFCLVAGACIGDTYRPPSWRRIAELHAAAAAVLVALLYLGQPGPLFLVALILARELVARWRIAWLPAAAATAAAQPFAIGPIVPEFGYWLPGLVLLIHLGHTNRQQLISLGTRLPHRLATIGRAPLAWYVGHLLLLVATVHITR